MPGSYRLLFLDLDGTLVGLDDVVSERTLRALHGAQEVGCTPVICTGRSRYTTRRVAEQIGGRGYVIVHNGGLIYEWGSGEEMQRRTLELELAREMVAMIHARGMAPLIFGAEEEDRWVYADNVHPLDSDWAMKNKARLVMRADLERDLQNPPISVTTYGPAAEIRLLAARFRENLGNRVTIIETGTRKYESWCLEIYAAGVDKAYGAGIVAERLGVPREQTMAIGDHLNDIAIIEWAGLGVVMGDSEPDVIPYADHVTGTQAEDGVAQAIEQFILPRA